MQRLLSEQSGLLLAGIGHDHFGFDDSEVTIYFDNGKITPILSTQLHIISADFLGKYEQNK